MQKNTVTPPTARLDRDALASYWGRLSREHLATSAEGWETICFAGMPHWFNGFMARYQRKAFERLLQGESFSGARVLDLGTGVGRWARWYAAWRDASVVGIDIEPERLARAEILGGGPQYLRMPVDRLEFADESFDVVNSVTVLQHVPYDARRRALAEAARVLRPGGRAVIFELTDVGDDAAHVFPWSADQWLGACSANGLKPTKSVGDQYIPLLRLAKRVHATALGGGARSDLDLLKGRLAAGTDRSALVALRLLTIASYPIEEVLRFLPPAHARIRGFLLVKPAKR